MNLGQKFLPIVLVIAGFEGARQWKHEFHSQNAAKPKIDVLKVDWGSPGFCTEYSRNYDPKTGACNGQKVFQRTFRIRAHESRT